MGRNTNYLEYIFHLSRLALNNKEDDLILYLKRLVSTFDDSSDKYVEELKKLIVQHKKSVTSFRGMKVAPTPVDLETRLELVRYSQIPHLEFEPIWDDGVLSKLNQIIIERKQSQGLAEIGLLPTKSAIFTGSPGVGKSLAAKWLAQQLGYPLLTLDLSAVMSSLLGRTGNNLRAVLDYAKSFECILLLDEIDSIAKKRDDNSDIGELKRLVTVILQEIEKWPSSSLLIAATNHPNLLDPAVWRRFDLVVDFPLPNMESINKAILLYFGHNSSIDSQYMRALTSSFVGSSYSDIERNVLRIRKRSALTGVSMEESIIAYLMETIDRMDKSTKLSFANLLLDSGVSQRKTSEITGYSRETLRRKFQ